MNKTTLSVSLAILVTALGSSASEAQESGFYLGTGLGSAAIDFDDARITTSAGAQVPGSSLGIDFDRAPLMSLTAGYDWGAWALEFEFEHSLGDSDLAIGRANLSGDFSYRNLKLQGVYRSPGDLYFLGKMGVSDPHLDVDLGAANFGLGTSGFLGFGGGYRLTPATALELEADVSSDDTRTFNLGLWHRF